MKKILVLYEELAPYFISSIETFSSEYNIEVHIISKKINEHAPFKFNIEKATTYARELYSETELFTLAKKINPTAIFCGGWIYKPYLRIAKHFKPTIPVILGFDNKFENTFRQKMAIYLSPFLIKPYFNKVFVPGVAQKKYAQKLGFSESSIELGLYSCDTAYFQSLYDEFKEVKSNHFPKRFIYIGRYVSFKGIENLWNAFIELYQEGYKDWELWCIGKGNIPPIDHTAIKHFGFLQPSEMKYYLSETSVFVLPSQIEPWGVVVHEFASAGFPLICSNQVGATEVFLQDGKNGFIFNDPKELKSALKKTMNMPENELLEMGKKSNELSKKITLQKWSNTMACLTQI